MDARARAPAVDDYPVAESGAERGGGERVVRENEKKGESEGEEDEERARGRGLRVPGEEVGGADFDRIHLAVVVAIDASAGVGSAHQRRRNEGRRWYVIAGRVAAAAMFSL